MNWNNYLKELINLENNMLWIGFHIEGKEKESKRILDLYEYIEYDRYAGYNSGKRRKTLLINITDKKYFLAFSILFLYKF